MDSPDLFLLMISNKKKCCDQSMLYDFKPFKYLNLFYGIANDLSWRTFYVHVIRMYSAITVLYLSELSDNAVCLLYVLADFLSIIKNAVLEPPFITPGLPIFSFDLVRLLHICGSYY